MDMGFAAAAACQISLFFGAENETRTRDPDLGKVVLYQLSYFRLKLRCKDTAFLNTTNVFLKKFYLEYNLLIIKFLVINFEGLQLSQKGGSRKMMTKN